jgi:hypothetical protein
MIATAIAASSRMASLGDLGRSELDAAGAADRRSAGTYRG